MPSPNCPRELLPQAQTVPSLLRAAVCVPPAEIIGVVVKLLLAVICVSSSPAAYVVAPNIGITIAIHTAKQTTLLKNFFILSPPVTDSFSELYHGFFSYTINSIDGTPRFK
ncbi:MAG: hypothetical protein FWD19_00500 [Defluviitaleaceae bacterium]|nr:hypothetical protein [Defluviitaleaceae bacterium]